MLKIASTLPLKTRIPFAAWALAGLITIFSLLTSLVSPTYNYAEQASISATAQYASVTELLKGAGGPLSACPEGLDGNGTFLRRLVNLAAEVRHSLPALL